MEDRTVKLRQETRYPWEGEVKITVDPEVEKEFAVLVRIPGWAQDRPVPSGLYRFWDERNDPVVIRVNGRSFPFTTEKGFARIHRNWARGDTVEIHLPMPVRMVASHENVQDNLGKAALQRGPLVYCFEAADNPGGMTAQSLPADSRFETVFIPELLGGMTVIKQSTPAKNPLTAVPYFAWAHRGSGEMAVWVRRQ